MMEVKVGDRILGRFRVRGQWRDRFLGEVIRIDPSHSAAQFLIRTDDDRRYWVNRREILRILQ